MMFIILIISLSILTINIYSYLESKKEIKKDLQDMENNHKELNKRGKIEKTIKKITNKIK